MIPFRELNHITGYEVCARAIQQAPIAAHAVADGARVVLRGVVGSLDGGRMVRVQGEAPVAGSRELGLALAGEASQAGALELIA